VTDVARLSSRPLFDGWLAGLMSSQRVPLRGKAGLEEDGPGGCEADCLCSPLKPRAILM
jgi:hypothetical protein